MELIRVAGARIAVRHWGEEDARPFVFWHALGPAGSGATILEVAPRLAARGFRVVAIDGPGFGGSDVLPPKRYELPELVKLLFALLDELRIDRAVLCGHSWGGAIAVHAAAERPGRTDALVLLDSGHLDYADLPDVDPERPFEAWLDEARSRPWRWPSRAAFESDLRDATRRWSPELLESFLAGTRADGDELAGAPAEARAAAMRGLARSRQSETWPAIARAQIPVLLVLATDDPWGEQNRTGLPRFLDAVPQADVRWLEETSHGILADRGPELGDELADWLAHHT